MIVCDPKVMLGKPVIAGSRVTVEAILEKLALGASRAEILRAYPHISDTDIGDSLAFAAASLSATKLFTTPSV
jgi:uncharacterized protein (DUF433 family)